MGLIDFLLTVKAATLIFISGRGSAIPSAKEGKWVLFIRESSTLYGIYIGFYPRTEFYKIL